VRPADLLGLQADFLRRFSDPDDNPDTRMMKTQVTAVERAIRARENGRDVDGKDLSEAIRDGRYAPMATNSVRHAAQAAQGGMPIMVSPQMVDLVSWVADDFLDTTAVDIGIAPAPYGFVWLDKPIIVPGGVDAERDRTDPDVHIDLLVWAPLPRLADGSVYDRHAYTFMGFNSSLRPDPVSVAWNEGAKADGFRGHSFMLDFLSAMVDGERLGEKNFGPMFCRPMIYDATTAEDGTVDGFGDQMREGQRLMEYATWNGPNVQRWLYALWVVMGQEIADVREEHADRATKRRMARMKLPPAITVITLRRPPSHRHEGESQVEWQHHWYVRGHPRWQACGPGRQERRLIWINPHVRGNLDAPLKQSTKVYRVAR
jgi:hypothetical protein